jgi:hypothetical protein
MMTTTRAIANDIGAALMIDHSCATQKYHSGMVVFPKSDRTGRYLRLESYFSSQPVIGNTPCVREYKVIAYAMACCCASCNYFSGTMPTAVHSSAFASKTWASVNYLTSGRQKNMRLPYRQAQRDVEGMQMRAWMPAGIAVVVAIGLIWSVAAMSNLVPLDGSDSAAISRPAE